MKGLRKHSRLFLVGSVGYSLVEIGWRRRTHWTMAAAEDCAFPCSMVCAERWQGAAGGKNPWPEAP